MTVETFKLFYRDSVWVASYAYNYVAEGTLVDVLSREPGMAISHGRLHDFVYGSIILFFDDYLKPHRYLSYFLSLISLVIFYLLSIRLGYSKIIAVASTLFLSITEHFLLSAHIARADILSFVIVLLVIYLMANNKQATALIAISGFVAAMGLDVHISTQIVLFMLAAFEFSKRIENQSAIKKRYRAFVLGYMVGLVVVVVHNVNYIDEVMEAYGFLNELALKTSIVDRITWFVSFSMSSRYYRWLFYPVTIVLVVFYFYARSPNSAENKTFYLFVGGLLGFVVLGRMNHHYLLLFFPFSYLYLISIAFSNKGVLAILYLSISTVMYVGIQAYVIRHHGGADFNAYANKVKAAIVIDHKTVIVGPDDLWFLFKSNEFYNYNARVNFNELFKNNAVLFVSNEISNRYIYDKEYVGKNTGVDKIPLEFLDSFKKIAQVNDRFYGGFGMTFDNTVVFYSNGEENK